MSLTVAKSSGSCTLIWSRVQIQCIFSAREMQFSVPVGCVVNPIMLLHVARGFCPESAPWWRSYTMVRTRNSACAARASCGKHCSQVAPVTKIGAIGPRARLGLAHYRLTVQSNTCHEALKRRWSHSLLTSDSKCVGYNLPVACSMSEDVLRQVYGHSSGG